MDVSKTKSSKPCTEELDKSNKKVMRSDFASLNCVPTFTQVTFELSESPQNSPSMNKFESEGLSLDLNVPNIFTKYKLLTTCILMRCPFGQFARGRWKLISSCWSKCENHTADCAQSLSQHIDGTALCLRWRTSANHHPKRCIPPNSEAHSNESPSILQLTTGRNAPRRWDWTMSWSC